VRSGFNIFQIITLASRRKSDNTNIVAADKETKEFIDSRKLFRNQQSLPKYND